MWIWAAFVFKISKFKQRNSIFFNIATLTWDKCHLKLYPVYPNNLLSQTNFFFSFFLFKYFFSVLVNMNGLDKLLFIIDQSINECLGFSFFFLVLLINLSKFCFSWPFAFGWIFVLVSRSVNISKCKVIAKLVLKRKREQQNVIHLIRINAISVLGILYLPLYWIYQISRLISFQYTNFALQISNVTITLLCLGIRRNKLPCSVILSHVLRYQFESNSYKLPSTQIANYQITLLKRIWSKHTFDSFVHWIISIRLWINLMFRTDWMFRLFWFDMID